MQPINQSLELVQEITIFCQDYKERPQLMLVMLGGFTMLVAVVCLAVITAGSFALILTALGMVEPQKPKPSKEPHRIKIV